VDDINKIHVRHTHSHIMHTYRYHDILGDPRTSPHIHTGNSETHHDVL
jgi:hypothetical protein